MFNRPIIDIVFRFLHPQRSKAKLNLILIEVTGVTVNAEKPNFVASIDGGRDGI